MPSPSEIAHVLVQIADDIDASQNPSATKVAADIKSVLAALPEEVTITDSSYDEFSQSDKELVSRGEDITGYFQCPATHSGTLNGKQFKFEYTMYLQVTKGVDADEDGMHSYTSASSDGFEDTDINVPSLKLNGMELDGSALEDAFESITQSDAFAKADLALTKKASSDIKYSEAVSNWGYELEEQASYERDPYSFYGVKPSDF